MITATREKKAILDQYDCFGEAMKDGRLTAPSDGKTYRLSEAILKSKQLGRPLTEDEMKYFEL